MKQPKLSKTYKYETGIDSHPIDEIETNSVNDMILFLQQFPQDMTVLASWEGQEKPFGRALISKTVDGKFYLLINVDAGQYDCFEDELAYP